MNSPMDTFLQLIQGIATNLPKEPTSIEILQKSASVSLPQAQQVSPELWCVVMDVLPSTQKLIMAIVCFQAESIFTKEARSQFAERGSQAIYELQNPLLMQLRLDLINHIIAHPYDEKVKNQNYLNRAHTKKMLNHDMQSVFEDVQIAMKIAQNQKQELLYIDALCFYISIKSSIYAIESTEFEALDHQLSSLLDNQWDVFTFQQLNQAQGELRILFAPQKAIVNFQKLLKTTSKKDPLFIDINSKILACHMNLSQASKGYDLVKGLFADITAFHDSHFYLYLNHAKNCETLNKHNEAIEIMKYVLPHVQGKNAEREAHCKIVLINCALETQNDENIGTYYEELIRDLQTFPPHIQREIIQLKLRLQGDSKSKTQVLKELKEHSYDETTYITACLQEEIDSLKKMGPSNTLEHHIHKALLLPAEPNVKEILKLVWQTYERYYFEKPNKPRVLSVTILEELRSWAMQNQQVQIVIQIEVHMHPKSYEKSIEKFWNTWNNTDAKAILAQEMVGYQRDTDSHKKWWERLRKIAFSQSLSQNLRNHMQLNVYGSYPKFVENIYDLETAISNIQTLQKSISIEQKELWHFSHTTLARLYITALSQYPILNLDKISATLTYFLQKEIPLPQGEANQMRMQAFQRLLNWGPVTTKEIVEEAEKLLPILNFSTKYLPLLHRYEWIKNCVEQQRLLPKEQEFVHSKGYDDMPAWLIEVIQSGRINDIESTISDQERELCFICCKIRLDRADQIISIILKEAQKQSQERQIQILSEISNCKEWIGPNPNYGWNISISNLQNWSSFPSEAHILLGQLQRDKSPLDIPSTASSLDKKWEGHFWKRYAKAIEEMQWVQLHPENKKSFDKIQNIRQQLELLNIEADESNKAALSISCGNSWRTSPGEDVERALYFYELAEKYVSKGEQEGQLYKVKADALINRATKEDLFQAQDLLEKALCLRKGFQYVETLFSKFRLLEKQRATLSNVTYQQLLSLLIEIFSHPETQKSKDNYFRKAFHDFVRILKDWYMEDCLAEINIWIREFQKYFPKHKDRDLFQFIPLVTYSDPAIKIYCETILRLPSSTEQFPKEMMETLSIKEASPFTNNQAIKKEIKALYAPISKQAYPGQLLAIASLQAYLVEQGELSIEKVKKTAKRILVRIQDVKSPRVQSIILHDLAKLFQPIKIMNNPMCDVHTSHNILLQCIEIEGGKERASIETLNSFVRSIRYNNDKPQENLRCAKEWFQKLLDRARKEEHDMVIATPDVIGTLLVNLSEIEGQLSYGDQYLRLQNEAKYLIEAKKRNLSSQNSTIVQSRLAWNYTLQADCLWQKNKDSESKKMIQDALDHFDTISPLSDNDRGNLSAAQSIRNRIYGTPEKSIDEYRTAIQDVSSSYEKATISHNLGRELLEKSNLSEEDIKESILLLQENLVIRKKNVRHHWEDLLFLSKAYRLLLTFNPEPVNFYQSKVYFERAVELCKKLGQGEELFLTAESGIQLLYHFQKPYFVHENALKIWSLFKDSIPTLLHEKTFEQREHRYAKSILIHIFLLFTQENSSIGTIPIVLDEQETEILQQWLIYEQAPNRRKLQNILYKPPNMPLHQWIKWQNVLSQKNTIYTSEFLEEIRKEHPHFLHTSITSQGMWDWLRKYPDSIAVASYVFPNEIFCIFVNYTRKKQNFSWTLGWKNKTIEKEDIQNFFQQSIIPSLYTFIGFKPKSILWHPHLMFRDVAPQILWNKIPIATTASFSFPVLNEVPSRKSSTLIVLADPGDLRDYGIQTVEKLTKSAQELGDVHILGSQKSRFGKILFPNLKHVIEKPANPKNLLHETKKHQYIILIAHGEVQNDEASFVCINEKGEQEKLGHNLLAESPDSFSGAKIILISCKSGLIGSNPLSPSGLAGTLIASGATWVVAPLIPIEIETGRIVASQLLHGISEGKEPWDIISNITSPKSTKSVLMGRPKQSKTQKEQSRMQAQLQFVTWVG